jgi:cysteinyl-tRNA synthetase
MDRGDPGVGHDGETGGASDEAASLRAVTQRLEDAFDRALGARDADAAVAAVLNLEASIVEWSSDTLQGDDLDRARAALRAMISRLGAIATDGVRDLRDVLGPIVEAALSARVTAREQRAFAVSDAIRDNLTAAGIEVRDTPSGVEWLVTDHGSGPLGS